MGRTWVIALQATTAIVTVVLINAACFWQATLLDDRFLLHANRSLGGFLRWSAISIVCLETVLFLMSACHDSDSFSVIHWIQVGITGLVFAWCAVAFIGSFTLRKYAVRGFEKKFSEPGSELPSKLSCCGWNSTECNHKVSCETVVTNILQERITGFRVFTLLAAVCQIGMFVFLSLDPVVALGYSSPKNQEGKTGDYVHAVEPP